MALTSLVLRDELENGEVSVITTFVPGDFSRLAPLSNPRHELTQMRGHLARTSGPFCLKISLLDQLYHGVENRTHPCPGICPALTKVILLL